jgi:PAS domain-containing protein
VQRSPENGDRGPIQRNEALLEAAARFAEVGSVGFADAALRAASRLSELTGEGCILALVTGGGTRLEPIAAVHEDPATHNRLLEHFCGAPPHGAGQGATALKGFSVRWTRGPYGLLSVPLTSPDGEVVGILGFVRFSAYTEDDVRASLALARAAANAYSVSRHIEQRARFLEAVDDAFFALSSDWRVAFANPKACELWGLTAEQVAERPIGELLPQLVGAEAYARLHEAVAARQPLDLELCSPLIGRWLQLRGFPKDTFFAVHLHDVDAIKAAELRRTQQLEREREARAAMEGAQRLREQMLAAVSDELRKPLDAIVAWTHVLASRAQDPRSWAAPPT